MLKLLFILFSSLGLAYCSQKGILSIELTKKRKLDLPLVIMIVMLCLFCGLRTNYNDTAAYHLGFNNSLPLDEYLDTNPKLMSNPLFLCMESFFKHNLGATCYLFTMLIAIFCNTTFVLFIRRHCSENFVFGILLYFTIGLYLDTFAAMKQCLALAVLMYALEALIKKKYWLYFLILFIAILIHSYAIFFIILPLFAHKPWTILTYLIVFGTAFALLMFESAITGFLEVAEGAGKNLADEELFDNVGINPFRLAVFAVPTIISFVFQGNVDKLYNRKNNIFINMSILSFLVMSLGLFTAANLFGRSAMYFEMGTIIILPKILNEIFERSSAKLLSVTIGALYIGFFMYDNINFASFYRAMSLSDFFRIAI